MEERSFTCVRLEDCEDDDDDEVEEEEEEGMLDLLRVNGAWLFIRRCCSCSLAKRCFSSNDNETCAKKLIHF